MTLWQWKPEQAAQNVWSFPYPSRFFPIEAAGSLSLQPSSRPFNLVSPLHADSDTLLTLTSTTDSSLLLGSAIDGAPGGGIPIHARFGICIIDGRATIKDCIVRGRNNGFQLTSGAEVTMENCTSIENYSAGVNIENGGTTLVGNQLLLQDNASYGLSLNWLGGVRLTSSLIQNNPTGIRQIKGTLIIEGYDIKNSSTTGLVPGPATQLTA